MHIIFNKWGFFLNFAHNKPYVGILKRKNKILKNHSAKFTSTFCTVSLLPTRSLMWKNNTKSMSLWYVRNSVCFVCICWVFVWFRHYASKSQWNSEHISNASICFRLIAKKVHVSAPWNTWLFGVCDLCYIKK